MFFFEACNEFIHSGNKNKLSQANLDHIYNAYVNRKDEEHFTKLVNNTEIAEQDYNLSVSTYVEQKDTREVIDIKVLNQQIADIVAKEQVLRTELDKIVAEIEAGA